MSEHTSSLERDARHGFVELFQDRLPHLPPPASAAMAEAVFAAAGLRRWDAWPERVELAGETVELPDALHPLVDDIRCELAERLASGEAGGVDRHVLEYIVNHLSNFPAFA